MLYYPYLDKQKLISRLEDWILEETFKFQEDEFLGDVKAIDERAIVIDTLDMVLAYIRAGNFDCM